MIRESLVAQIWKQQLISREALMTADGKGVQVLFPGRQNSDRGPDFCHATITIDGGKRLHGDVELHVRSREWQAHGHHRDPNYNGVILHVVMWNDGREVSVLQSGEKVPILALSPYLSGSLEELQQAVHLSLVPKGAGHQVLHCHDGAAVGELLDKAGEERFRSKSARFRAKAAANEPDEVLYGGIMRGLGYAKNKGPFEELARLLPLSALKQFATRGDTVEMQALMLGVAGLLPAQRLGNYGSDHLSGCNEPEVKRLQQAWRAFDVGETMSAFDWRFFRVRPENFPPRRIVAASYLLSRHGGGLLGDMLATVGQASVGRVQRELEQSLMVQVGGYWASHYDFGIEAGWNPSLIGRGRAREIVVNVVLPFLFAWGEKLSQTWLKDRAMQLYRDHPRLGENSVTRYMERQIFGEDQAKVTSVCQQQGLIHFYEVFCVEGRCYDCPLG